MQLVPITTDVVSSNTEQTCWYDDFERERIMVFNATFNNISVISWWSVLLMEENGVPEENH
jgi:hypothetical protein